MCWISETLLAVNVIHVVGGLSIHPWVILESHHVKRLVSRTSRCGALVWSNLAVKRAAHTFNLGMVTIFKGTNLVLVVSRDIEMVASS